MDAMSGKAIAVTSLIALVAIISSIATAQEPENERQVTEKLKIPSPANR